MSSSHSNMISRFSYHLAYILGMPVFAMLFAIFYGPTFNQEHHVVQMWTEDSSLSVPVICSIILGVLLISRSLLVFVVRRRSFGTFNYLFWQFVEFVFMGLFCALFLALRFHRLYFDLLPIVLLYGFLVLIIPYVILWQWTQCKDYELRVHEAESQIYNLQNGIQTVETGTINFMDEKGTTKLAVSVERIIYIESAANYVNVVYDNDGQIVRYALRNSLKGIEKCCEDNGLIRCHRSYFVNLRKVKLLRREGDLLYAEIDFPGIESIPVSKSYAGAVMHSFSSQSKE